MASKFSVICLLVVCAKVVSRNHVRQDDKLQCYDECENSQSQKDLEACLAEVGFCEAEDDVCNAKCKHFADEADMCIQNCNNQPQVPKKNRCPFGLARTSVLYPRVQSGN